MEVNPYRVLVQLIPGSLFLGIILVNEVGVVEIGLMGAATITFLALLSIIFGYVFNGIGHFTEGFFKPSLEGAIQKNLTDSSDGGRFIRLFRRFSVLRIDETISRQGPDPQPVRRYNQESRIWSKEENKFARTLVITSVLLLIYIYCYDMYCMNVKTRFYVRLLLWVLFVVSFYRNIVSSIDYSYKRKNRIVENMD